jgi:hypothetical protein
MKTQTTPSHAFDDLGLEFVRIDNLPELNILFADRVMALTAFVKGGAHPNPHAQITYDAYQSNLRCVYCATWKSAASTHSKMHDTSPQVTTKPLKASWAPSISRPRALVAGQST